MSCNVWNFTLNPFNVHVQTRLMWDRVPVAALWPLCLLRWLIRQVREERQSVQSDFAAALTVWRCKTTVKSTLKLLCLRSGESWKPAARPVHKQNFSPAARHHRVTSCKCLRLCSDSSTTPATCLHMNASVFVIILLPALHILNVQMCFLCRWTPIKCAAQLHSHVRTENIHFCVKLAINTS